MAVLALLAGCGTSHRTSTITRRVHPTRTITGRVIFDRPENRAVTLETHGYGVVEISDSQGRLLQTRNVRQGYGHVPGRDRFVFHLDPGRYVVHLTMFGPAYLVSVHCPPATRTQSADVQVRHRAKVVLGDMCASY